MKKFSVMLLSIVFLLGMAGVAAAIPVQFVNVSPGLNTTVHSDWYNGGAATGVYNLIIDGTPLASYCIDLQDDASTAVHDYNLVGLANAPDPTAGPMEPASALALENLWAMNYTNSLTSNTNAAAMQMAIWEIVAEDTGTWDVSSGDFYVTNYGSTTAPVSEANALLAALATYTGAPADLMAVSSNTYQDYLVPVPEPATMLLLGMGLVGLAGLGRKRFFKI